MQNPNEIPKYPILLDFPDARREWTISAMEARYANIGFWGLVKHASECVEAEIKGEYYIDAYVIRQNENRDWQIDFFLKNIK